MAVSSFGMIALNISIIQEACITASDYFTLLDREVLIDENNSINRPSRENVMGRI